jgi:hypothetical protein
VLSQITDLTVHNMIWDNLHISTWRLQRSILLLSFL